MEITVTGLREVEEKLIALGQKTGTKILRQSMLAAARPILDQAKSNVQSISGGSGALHKSLGMKFYIGKQNFATDNGLPALGTSGGRFTVQIAPLKTDRTALALHNLFYGRRRRGIFYGHLVEFGHRNRGGKGFTSAHPFLLPALNAKGPAAVAALADEIRKRVANELEK